MGRLLGKVCPVAVGRWAFANLALAPRVSLPRDPWLRFTHALL